MKIIITQYKVPVHPYTRPPQFLQERYDTQDEAAFRARPGFILVSAALVADEAPFPVHVHPDEIDCTPGCPVHPEYTEPE